MISAEELSALLGTLYSAPLEPEKWQEFFNLLCGLTRSHSGVFIESRYGIHKVLASGGTDLNPEPLQLYNVHYAPQDPYSIPCLQRQQVGVFTDAELVPRDKLVRTEFYNDLLRRFDMEHLTVVPCRLPVGGADVISLWRGQRLGPLEPDCVQLLELLVPHLQTALKLHVNVVAHEMTQLFSEAALDAMSIAAFLVSGDGRVRHMNRMAARYAGKGEGLQVRGGRLVTSDSEKAGQLETMLRSATSAAAAGNGVAPGGAMRTLRPSTRSQLELTVVPAPERNRLDSTKRYALVFVTDPAQRPASRADVMQHLYDLTPAECRLADLLLQGMDVREAAERLRITIETARFHLKRVLRKTGARRQAELIRMMLLLPGGANGRIGVD